MQKKDSSTVKRAQKFFTSHLRAFSRFCRQNPEILVIFFTFFISGLLIGIYRYNNYLDGFDFTVFREAIWKYAHLIWPDSSVRGLNFIEGDHFHPIIALIAPLYFVFTFPYTLIAVQAFFIALSVFPVYIFAKQKLHTRLNALLASTLYITSAGLQWMLFFDFHEILFAVPLIAWSILFIDRKEWRPLIITLALLAITKEEMFIYIFSVGALLIVTRWNIKLGAIISATGVFGFLLLNSVIMPFLAGKRSFGYWSYTAYGASLGDAVISTLMHPVDTLRKIIGDLTTPEARLTLALWLKPLTLVLPLLSPYFLLSILLMLTKFLSDFQSYSVHTFHYGGPLAPIFAMAFIDGLTRVSIFTQRSKFFSKNRIVYTYTPLLLVFCLIISYNLTDKFNGPLTFIRDKRVSGTLHFALHDEPTIKRIVGVEASLLAPDTVTAHFADRRQVFAMLPMEKWDKPSDKIINPKSPRDVKYVLLNRKLPSNEFILSQAYGEEFVYTTYDTKLKQLGFFVNYSNDISGWILYENEDTSVR